MDPESLQSKTNESGQFPEHLVLDDGKGHTRFRLLMVLGLSMVLIAVDAIHKDGANNPNERVRQRIAVQSAEKALWLKAAFDKLDEQLKKLLEMKKKIRMKIV